MLIFFKIAREALKVTLDLAWEALTKKPISASISIDLTSGYNKEKPMQRTTDIKLSDHFGLFEMSHTDNVALQAQNRDISDEILEHLTATARLMEQVRNLTGNVGIKVNSAYRCLALNGDIPGASPTSQHPKGEACDFFVIGQSVQDTFALLKKCAEDGKIWFGQMILETRGTVSWCHISLADPYRDLARCGQIMFSPENGKYEIIKQINKPLA